MGLQKVATLIAKGFWEEHSWPLGWNKFWTGCLH